MDKRLTRDGQEMDETWTRHGKDMDKAEVLSGPSYGSMNTP